MENKEWNFEPTPSEPSAYEPEAYNPDPSLVGDASAEGFQEPDAYSQSPEPAYEPYSEPSYSSAFEPSPSYQEPNTDDFQNFSQPIQPTTPVSEPVSFRPPSAPAASSAHSSIDLAAMLREQEQRLRDENMRTLQALKAQDTEDFTPDLGYEYMTQQINPERYQLNPILSGKLTDNISDEVLFEKHEQATAEQNEAYRKLMYLKKQINKDLAWYNRKYRKFSFTASAFKIAVVLLSSIVTVLLGLDYVASGQEQQQILKDVALLMSAMIAVITGLERFFDAKDLMVQYMKTYDKLEQMKSTIEYIEVGGHYNLVEVEKLKLKYDKIVVSTSNFVVEVRADEN